MMPRSQLTKPAALAGLLLLSGSGAGISLAADKEAGSGADTDAADGLAPEALVDEHPFHAPADRVQHGGRSPLSIWEGAHDSYLRATLKVEGAYFDQSDAWFGNAVENIGTNTNDWWEWVIHPGIDGSYKLPEHGEAYGRFSFVNSNTQDIDAAGSNAELGDVSFTNVENAYLGWRSGDLFGSLGQDALDISFGMQQYVVGTGFLFYSESSNGANRGAYWIGERKAAKYAGIVRLDLDRFKGSLVYLKANDNPSTNTRLGGATLDYDLGDFGGVGGGYYHVTSDMDTRDGMNVYDIRFQTTPFKGFEMADALKPIKLDGEYVYEDNGSALKAAGWYLSAGYDWEAIAWKPGLTYRYANFQGNNPNSATNEDFDPLFYGFYDWGYWYQGEILGEYVLTNSNLKSHMVRLSVQPLASVHANLFYYNFKLDDAAAFGVTSDDFANEWNLTLDWTIGDAFALSLVGAYAQPNDGAKQYTGGDDGWAYGMIYASYTFK